MSNQLFLNFLIHRKILTNEQAENCLQKSIEEKKALATLLVQQGLLENSALKKHMEEFQQFTLSLPPETHAEAIAEVDLSILDEILQVPSASSKGKTVIQSNTPKESTLLQQESVSPQTQTNVFALPQKEPSETSERYTLLEVLGEGGMGVVERVKDQVLKREVALKRIKLPAGAKQHLAKAQRVLLWRFRREASITAILEHPNIIPLHDMEEKASGDLYFTMCKVDGETLTKKLRKKREQNEELEEHTILSIYMKVCDAISYAHSRGVIHRDLKPDNIMIGKFGEVYVMDWGIAKLVHETENELENENSPTTDIVSDEGMKTIGGMGTPGYMAPEQAEDAGLATPRSDIYALGKILRECYTQLSPYEELMQRQKAERLLEKAKKKNMRTAVNKREERIPRDILAIIEKAVKESAEERYESVQELAKDIDDYLHHREVSAKEYTFFELLSKWFQRNRQKGIATCLVLLLFGGFFLYSIHEKKRKINKTIGITLQKAQKTLEDIQKDSRDDFHLQGEKIQILLEIFNNLNTALKQKSDHFEEINQKKWETGKALITLMYKREEYELLGYIQDNLKEIVERSEVIKKELQHLEENSPRKKNLKRFGQLLQNLEAMISIPDFETKQKNIFNQKKEEKELIFEISKMNDEAILENLLRYLKEGVTYIQETEIPSIARLTFFQILVKALGKLENPKAGPDLKEGLETIVQKKIVMLPLNHKRSNIELAELEYAITLAEALADLREVSYITTLEAVRGLFHSEDLFFKRTEIAYVRLLSFLKMTNEPLVDAPSYLKRGVIREKRGEFDFALQDFTQAITLNPQDPEAYNARGEVYFKLVEYEKAEEDFLKAIQLNPNFIHAIFNQIQILMQRFDKPEIRELLYKNIQNILHLDPDHQKAYLLQASFFDLETQHIKRFEIYQTILALNPQNYDVYYNRGVGYFFRKYEGDMQRAVLDLQQTLRFSPYHYEAWAILGATYLILGKRRESLFCYDRAIAINPHSKHAFGGRAKIRKILQDKEGSLLDINQTILLDPDNSEGYYDRGNIEWNYGMYEEALRDFNKAIELGHGYAFVYRNRGIILHHYKKNKAAAEADFIKFLEMTSNDTSPVTIKFRDEIIKAFPNLEQYR